MHLQLQSYSGPSSQLARHLRLSGAIAVLLVIGGCASTTVYQPAEVEDRDVKIEESRQTDEDQIGYQLDLPTEGLQVEDLNTSRARYYQQRAENEAGESRVDAILSAAELYIQGEDYRGAERAVDDLYGEPLSLIQEHRLRVINAYIAYAQGDYSGTLNELRSVLDYRPPLPEEPVNEEPEQPATIPVKPRLSTQQVDALLLSSFAYQQMDAFNLAIHALIEREGALVGQARSETTRYIWQVIDSIPEERRRSIIDTTQYPLVRNRLEQSLNSQIGNADLSPQQFTQWREQASSDAPQTLTGEWNSLSPRSIAVLLPLSSRFRKAATAVREGIEYQHDQNRSVYRPELRFYDIGESPYAAVQYYSAAVQSGADFIIGPLGKDYANQVSSYGGARTPTLLLGGDTPISAGMSRFGMGPEMEGQRVAERAWKDGHLSAALMVPEDAVSQRTVDAFTQRWLGFGGKISKIIRYSPKQFDHSVELKQLFDINQSQYRYSRLSRTLGYKPEFNPYQSSDLDFIFMIADNETGRLLRPQINFYSGSRVPVYATSDIFNGIPDPIENLDLNETVFPVMPWVIKSVAVAPYAGQLNMLFALGSDAYQIAGSYQQLRRDFNSALNGNTGQISINPYGEAIYQPVWARFQEGIVVPEETLGIDINPINAPNSEEQGRSNSQGVYNDRNWNPSKGEPRRRSGGQVP